MDDTTFAQVVRGLIIVTSAFTLVGFAVRLYIDRKVLDFQMVFLYVGCLFLLFAMAARAYISIERGAPFVWPLYPFMIGLGCFIAFLTAPRRKL